MLGTSRYTATFSTRVFVFKMATTSIKRKRNVLTIEQKLEILNKREKGESVASLSRIYEVGKQTIRDIIKNKVKLQNFITQSDSFKNISARKSLKGSTFQQLDEALSKWFLQKRSEGVPISGPMCAKQAEIFHEHLKIKEPFNASSGWLHRFKKRRGIRELTIQGEKLSADGEVMVEFCYELETIITENNLQSSQIYNADETGLYWRAIPTKTLAASNEMSAPGYKKSKDRITVLCCANASGGHRLKLTVIGKSKNPRAFKNMKPHNLPVHYYNQQAAWITCDIFQDWFHKKFIPEVKSYLKKENLPQKALLLLDNARSHPNEAALRSDDGNFFVLFFPPNVTSIAQPMDQGVIETMKRLYRKELMMNLLDEVDLMKFWKSFTIKDAIFTVANAWSGVKEMTFKRAFYKIMTLEEDESIVESDDEETTITEITALVRSSDKFKEIDETEVERWTQCDKNEPGYQLLNDDDIVAQVLNQPGTSQPDSTENESQDEENDGTVSVKRVTNREAEEAANVLLDYFEQRESSDLIDILNLRRIRQTIKKDQRILTQTKVTDFFSKA